MPLRVALAQLNPTVGDLDGNARSILEAWRGAADVGADVVVFTELALTGYPPEDLLLKSRFVAANVERLAQLAAEGPAGTVAVVGHVGMGADNTDRHHWDVGVATRGLTNAASVLADGAVVATYAKGRLPNYGVFDEARYFVAGHSPLVVNVADVPVGVTVCEDLWTEQGPVAESANVGARVVVNLNASPYHRGKRTERERWVRHHATTRGVHFVYVNQVGGQDELVFDGDSMVCQPDGTVGARGAQFDEDLVVVDLDADAAPAAGCLSLTGGTTTRPDLAPREDAPRLDPVAEVFEALVLGTRDYCHKNGFIRAVIGLSGGIDSALTAAVAARALGADHVLGVAMPSRYSSEHSLEDARVLAEDLVGMPFAQVPIDPVVRSFEGELGKLFAGVEPDDAAEDVTWQNIQARVRGVILMAISNRTGRILLTTGNKSELAVGYATLYGDMAGGFAVLKDTPKTLVYELARHAREAWNLIPERSIIKPPSAELKPGQQDSDSLPPYEVLDPILQALVEEDRNIDDIVASGIADEETVRRVARLLDRAEYKRRQAAPGVKITERAFGKDRRVPITNGWR
ncbi:MAG: NAD+ synthase [Actinobacteria bacterium]|nr:NAD+ synthase [Actinomycetota bacterium]